MVFTVEIFVKDGRIMRLFSLLQKRAAQFWKLSNSMSGQTQPSRFILQRELRILEEKHLPFHCHVDRAGFEPASS